MKTTKLVENLGRHVETIRNEAIEMIDFDSLIKDLENTAEALLDLELKSKLSGKFLADTKSEIRRMSLAVSRAKGDASGLDLTERLLQSEGLDYDDLILLKDQVKAEFNRTFPGKPVHRVVERGRSSGSRILEFKVGTK
jgi:hypothetical protein